METEQYLLSGIIFFIVGAASALVPANKFRTTSYLFSLVGSLSFLVLGFFLTFSTPISYETLSVSPVFEFSLRGDALSGFFILTISVVSLAVSIYSIGFTRDLPYAGLAGFFYNILVFSLYAVVLSANLFAFLISWETMAIASFW
jgi:hydrogenase-4 component B